MDSGTGVTAKVSGRCCLGPRSLPLSRRVTRASTSASIFFIHEVDMVLLIPALRMKSRDRQEALSSVLGPGTLAGRMAVLVRFGMVRGSSIRRYTHMFQP